MDGPTALQGEYVFTVFHLRLSKVQIHVFKTERRAVWVVNTQLLLTILTITYCTKLLLRFTAAKQLLATYFDATGLTIHVAYARYIRAKRREHEWVRARVQIGRTPHPGYGR